MSVKAMICGTGSPLPVPSPAGDRVSLLLWRRSSGAVNYPPEAFGSNGWQWVDSDGNAVGGVTDDDQWAAVAFSDDGAGS